MRHPLLAAILIGAGMIGPLAYAQANRDAEAITAAKREAQQALERSKALEQQSKSATDEAARARAESSALAARIEAAEADITAAETRVRSVERMRNAERARLAAEQEPIVRLVAALQTMGRRPPALALVQPGSLENMIHVRALLASTLPVVRARTAALREQVKTGERLHEEAGAAVADLRSSQEELRTRRLALARFETNQQRQSQDLAASALFQSDRALALTEEAREISTQANTRQYQDGMRRELAELPGPIPRPTRTETIAPRPALRYRLPIAGELTTGTGEISDSGVHSRGLTFRVIGNRPVVAPTGGRIAYAGPFRSYANVVIIDHGRGWTSVITGITRLEVAVGDRVQPGGLLGRTGAAQGRLSVELRREGRPVPIALLLAPG